MVILIVSLIGAGCGSNSNNKTGAPATSNTSTESSKTTEPVDNKLPFEGVELKVVLIGGGLYEEMYKNIPAFEKETGAKVNILFKGNHFDLDKKIKLDFAVNTVDFDVFSNHSSFYTQYLDASEPLNSYFTSDELKDFLPNILEQLTKNGNLYIIPRHADISMFLYRKDIFDDAKFQADYSDKTGKELKVPETWDDFKEISLWWGNRDGIYATQFAGKEEAISGRFYELLTSNGGTFLSDDLKKVTFNGPEGVKGAQMLQDLYKAGAMPAGMVNFMWDEVAKNFANGNILMYTDWYGWYNYFQDPENSKVAGKIDFSRQPKGDGGIHGGWSGAHGFSIAKASKNKEAAAAFIKFLTSEQSLYEESSKGFLAVRDSVANKLVDDAKSSGDEMKVKLNELAKLQIGSDFRTPPLVPTWIPMSNVLFPQLQRIILGDVSAQDGLNKAAEEAQKILDTDGK
jgi:multiple sugar transport system substrate-binding protein